jgi:hypothetical protein
MKFHSQALVSEDTGGELPFVEDDAFSITISTIQVGEGYHHQLFLRASSLEIEFANSIFRTGLCTLYRQGDGRTRLDMADLLPLSDAGLYAFKPPWTIDYRFIVKEDAPIIALEYLNRFHAKCF